MSLKTVLGVVCIVDFYNKFDLDLILIDAVRGWFFSSAVGLLMFSPGLLRDSWNPSL